MAWPKSVWLAKRPTKLRKSLGTSVGTAFWLTAQDQLFILDVATFDLAMIIEQAFRKLPGSVDNLLKGFLNLDQTVRTEAQEQRLMGVWRAQIQIATFFLAQHAENLVNRVLAGLLGKDQEGRERIIDALTIETQDIFWKFTPTVLILITLRLN